MHVIDIVENSFVFTTSFTFLKLSTRGQTTPSVIYIAKCIKHLCCQQHDRENITRTHTMDKEGIERTKTTKKNREEIIKTMQS